MHFCHLSDAASQSTPCPSTPMGVHTHMHITGAPHAVKFQWVKVWLLQQLAQSLVIADTAADLPLF